jgi:hypothetical protein
MIAIEASRVADQLQFIKEGATIALIGRGLIMPDGEPGALSLDHDRLDDPAYLRELAADARSAADKMADSDAKQTMLLIAESFGLLAENAEARLRTLRP